MTPVCRPLFKPPLYLASIQISLKETANPPLPLLHRKTWNSKFLQKETAENSSQTPKNPPNLLSQCCRNLRGEILITYGVGSWRFVRRNERTPQGSPKSLQSKYSERTISEAVFSAPSYRGEWPLCATCQLSANGRSLLQVNGLSLAAAKKTH